MEQQLTWVAAAALVIGAVVRVLKSDSPLPEWLHVSKQWRPWLAVALGIVAGVLDAVAMGTPWADAVAKGVLASVGAMAGHHLVIEKGRGGKELPVPFARPRADSGDNGDMGKDAKRHSVPDIPKDGTA